MIAHLEGEGASILTFSRKFADDFIGDMFSDHGKGLMQSTREKALAVFGLLEDAAVALDAGGAQDLNL